MSSSTVCTEQELVLSGIDTSEESPITMANEARSRSGNENVNGSRPTTSAEVATTSAEIASSSRKEKNYGPQDMVKVFVPVSICMAIVTVITRTVEIYRQDVTIKTPYVIYHDPEAEAPTKLWHSLVNAATFLCVIVVSTFGVLALFYFKFYRCLNFFIMFSTFMLITTASLMQYYEVLRAINFPISSATVLLLHTNMAVIGLMSIFWKGPRRVQQGTLVLMAAMVTLTIMRVLPRWTNWAMVILLAFWDLCAVLSPCGPLKILVETAEERGEDLMPAIIYTGAASIEKTESTQGSQTPPTAVDRSPTNEKRSASRSPLRRSGSQPIPSNSVSAEEESNIRLGLGDFIFYSLLVGNATVLADWTTIVACAVSILVGLAFTLVLLVIFQKALPALPISIAFGAIAFFSSKFVTSKYLDRLNSEQIFL
ncbi:hypothetical protein Y032_0065g3646 [Ancylostoma ceylanicum]|uniref:Presenilin n=1 Tax=Ancylostoma ceylanicum TaxID=53326 RepID=A0A016U204_9BILA|nr:hypothetical protein Y032_0065g3646 [Ancylostoma ceylanicum]